METKKTLVYNCIIDEVDDTTGIYAISFVDMPANEVDFVALRKQSPHTTQLSRDNQKQVLTGAILKPDQLIYRYSPAEGEYYIRFSAHEIEKIAQKMMKTGVALHNTTHRHQNALKGNYLTELWIVEDPEKDKSKALGFSDLPKGTLMCSYKVEDSQYWQREVMTGNVKGFSLEGFFTQTAVNLSKVNQTSKTKNKQMNNQKKTLLNKLADLLLGTEDVQRKDSIQSGEAYVLFVLADGKEVYVDQDGFATLDDEQMPAGEHKLADGNLLVIDKDGQFVETQQVAQQTSKPKDAVAPQTMRKRVRLQEFEAKTAQAVKAKIAEMQGIIDELAQALTDAQSMIEDTKQEVEEMRKKTPSAQPLKQKLSFENTSEMSNAERMAFALNQRNRK